MHDGKRTLRRGARRFACLGLAALLLWNVCLTASASPKKEERVILSVWPKARYSGRDYYGAGARLTLYKVADAALDRSGRRYAYTLTDDFRKVNIDFSSVRPDGIDTFYTEMLEKYIRKNKILGTTLVTDENGRGNFLDLTPGFYLVLQTGAEKAYSKKYKDINPFAICLPLQCLDTNGEIYLEYQVTVCPKLETKPLDYDSNKDESASPESRDEEGTGDEGGGGGKGGGLPQTGLERIRVYVLSAAGVLLLATGAYLVLCPKKREWEEDEEDET